MDRAHPASTEPGQALWAFALAAYALGGVSARCLALQDRQGAVVMVLLALCALAARGIDARQMDIPVFAARADLTERHLLAPLRAARRALAAAGPLMPGSKAIADALLERELRHERLQADLLAREQRLRVDHSASDADAADRANALLAAYLQHLGMQNAAACDAARSLAAAVFADAPAAGARV
ncbi:MAG: TIGR02444 family protein [Gammaproteobacteria bacterium]